MEQQSFDKPIRLTVGYMLMILKNGITIPDQFKKPFAEIRHGNYHAFIQLIGGSTGDVVVYNAGDISLHKQSYQEDFAFLGLLKASNSLHIFFTACNRYFGKIKEK